ncbi:MAG: hypothetical protein H7836_16320, partial [Magnetococcus sp. YQC-3]
MKSDENLSNTLKLFVLRFILLAKNLISWGELQDRRSLACDVVLLSANIICFSPQKESSLAKMVTVLRFITIVSIPCLVCFNIN